MKKSKKTPAAAGDDRVVKAAIYPGIGVARLGNSQNDFYIGPEVPDPAPEPPGFYRDATGALKREAARVRIYGLNAEGRAVRELTAKEAKIEWTVHLANKKSAWYQFQLALDIPEANSVPPSLLRNAAVPDRSRLVIDPGARSITGANQSGGKKHTFDTGKFMGKTVYLGELRTDEAGRLIVLGGRGVSASFDGTVAITFANNEGWHDDISDGPVTATVTYGGRKLEVSPSWVIVGPPNYAPNQKSVRTMWDVMRDVAISANMLTKPARPSFDQDIRPLFERMSNLQWVNAGLPTFWPARVPNQVLTNENYEIVMDKDRPLGERLAAFANRAAWIRVLGTKSYTDQINNMIRDYGKLGVVEVRKGPGDKEFPATMEVEQLPPQKVLLKAVAAMEEKEPERSADDVDLTGIEKVHRFPFGLRR